MIDIVLLWLWIGIVMAGISVFAGPNPIVAWIIMTIIATPPLIWVEHDIKRRTK